MAKNSTEEFWEMINSVVGPDEEENTENNRAEEPGASPVFHNGVKVYIGSGITFAMAGIMLVTEAVYAVRFARAFVGVSSAEVFPSAYMTLLTFAAMLGFMVSTTSEFWNYDLTKKIYLGLFIVLLGVQALQFYYSFAVHLVVPVLTAPEPNEFVTKGDWLFLIRLLTIAPPLILALFNTKAMFEIAFGEYAYTDIRAFRVLDHIDLRRGRRNLYDVSIVSRLKNGTRFVIREKQRWEHMLAIGASGTAKTTSVLIPIINGDLVHKYKNVDAQKKAVVKMLEEGKLYMNSPTTDEGFTADAFTAKTKEYRAEFDRLLNKYRDIGITFMAPDDSASDEIYERCLSKGIRCNRVDPVVAPGTDGKKKEGFVSFNPLYISPDTPRWAYTTEISKRAILFADVLQALQDMKGKTDPYFTSLNRSVTVAFSILLCATFERVSPLHCQPTPANVQELVGDFKRVNDYFPEFKMRNETEFDHIFDFVVDFINYEILGEGRDKMNDQARGLRTSMNEFLAQPLVKRVLCPGPDDPILDMDKMLSDGQITVINYAKQLGDNDSRGLGIFILLSFFNAVYRRPGNENTRIPHILVIDEVPELLHPKLDSALSTFRKYRCSLLMAMQSLKQMNKNEETKYMKDTILEGCAHHFVFGRCSTEEMEEYSRLAGMKYKSSETYTSSETTLTDENPAYSYGVREQVEETEVVSGTSIRNKHFQEITMFSVVNGNLIPPFEGKVHFLKPSTKNPVKRKKYDWDGLYSRYGRSFVLPGKSFEENIAATDALKGAFTANATAADTRIDGAEAAAGSSTADTAGDGTLYSDQSF